MDKYDVVVIGSGPGGYVAAIRCAQLGFKTAVIEKYSTLGGTCLNVGCIPSKALLDSSEHYHNLQTNFSEHGINVKSTSLDFAQMISRKDKVVSENTSGISFLMKKNKIDVYHGVGSFITKNKIAITTSTLSNGEGSGVRQEIETSKVIIATGSKPASLPFIKIDKKRIITSTEALSLKEIPSTMMIIGGGIIGVEMGSVYARLGTKVQIIEFMDNLIPSMDKELGKELQKVFKKQGLEIFLSHKVKSIETKGKSMNAKADDSAGKEFTFSADYCLVAVGRKPYTENLDLEKIGVKTDDRGRIPVDKNLQTAMEGVYAIGDVIAGAMLAHKAEDEGMFVAEIIAGQKPHIDYNLIPSVAYTWPEVASVGQTEEQLKQQGIEFKIGKFPFKASGRARASMDTDGFIQVLADKKTDEILGVHMIGPRIADLIAEAVVAMEFRASAEDIARISHAHPTYTEAFREACLAATGNRAIHM